MNNENDKDKKRKQQKETTARGPEQHKRKKVCRDRADVSRLECKVCEKWRLPHDFDDNNIGCFVCEECLEDVWEDETLLHCHICLDSLSANSEYLQRCCECHPSTLATRMSLFLPWSLASFRCIDCANADTGDAKYGAEEGRGGRDDKYDPIAKKWTCFHCVREEEQKQKCKLLLVYWYRDNNNNPNTTLDEVSLSTLPLELLRTILTTFIKIARQ